MLREIIRAWFRKIVVTREGILRIITLREDTVILQRDVPADLTRAVLGLMAAADLAPVEAEEDITAEAEEAVHAAAADIAEDNKTFFKLPPLRL